ncbi:hypothetical protein Tco_0965466 [Tanacetum coccineum]
MRLHRQENESCLKCRDQYGVSNPTGEKNKEGNNGNEKKWEKDPSYNISENGFTRRLNLTQGMGKTLSTMNTWFLFMENFFPTTSIEETDIRKIKEKRIILEDRYENVRMSSGLATTMPLPKLKQKFQRQRISKGVSLLQERVRKCGGRLGHNNEDGTGIIFNASDF